MKCIKCGAENPDAAMFCGTCGAKMESVEDKRNQLAKLEQELQELKEKKERYEEEKIKIREQIEAAKENVKKLGNEKKRMLDLLLTGGEEK